MKLAASRCETEIAASNENCGACGHGCPAGSVCAASSCRLPDEVVQLSAGRFHVCARRAGGDVLCWGQNDMGQLGRGFVSPFEAAPASVDDVSDVVQLASGISTTCARLRDGGVACWGDGQHYLMDSRQEASHATRVKWLPVRHLAALALSMQSYALGLTREGELWGWGNNERQNLVDDPTDDVRSPTLLPVRDVVAVAANHAKCAIRASGRLECWGSNDFGEVANFKVLETAKTPVDVSEVRDALTIRSGWTMAAADASGTAYGWGCWPATCSWGTTTEAVAVPGATDVVMWKSGPLHSCALRKGGRVRCFGQSSGLWGQDLHVDGLLGTGNFPERGNGLVHYDESRDVIGISDAIDLDISSVSTCVIRAGGRVSCWGDNSYGQLGNGTTDTSRSPVDVLGVAP